MSFGVSPERPATRDGDRRRQIEAAAGVLFRERGYVGTSVRQIAQALDLQGASLYSHVASKEDVLWSIVQRTADRFEAVQAQAAGLGLPADRLRALIAAHVAVVATEREHAAVFLHEWRFLGPQRRAEMLRRRDAYEATVRELIAQGIADGSLRPVDPRLTAAALLSALNGIAAWYRPDGPDDPATIGQAYADLFLRGLAAPQKCRPEQSAPQQSAPEEKDVR
ncbi:MAG TPA: TetR/AcrR family transcriptional regulator [Candidatus Limnocylindrales bacterium]|nr:TetR/AcrR family transcriptional regulator [Candidatus Limnocylindrales bacterium]